jgi:HK97 family phage prohead protease
MPWEIVQEDQACPASRPFGVHKVDDGELEGCHATYADADDQMSALYMAESDEDERAEDDTFSPPQGVRDAAARALEWIAEGLAGDGFTDVGRARASQLANGESVSRQTVGRMANYFGRHASDRDAEGFNSGEDGYPTPGRVAWDAWGGDAGRTWSTGIVAAEERNGEESAYPLSSLQLAQYEVLEDLTEVFGMFDPGIGADGAHYMAESPFAEDGMVCANCVFYEGPRGCEIVSGEIAPEGICKFWIIPEQLLAGGDTAVPVEEAPSMEAGGEDMDEYERTADGFSTPDREVRRLERVELRQDEDGLPIVEGYATVYDYRYDIAGGPEAGGFTEVIARGAASKSAAEAPVPLLVNHDGIPLAHTRSGTLKLESDDIGLRISATLDPTNPTAAEVRSALERGDMSAMSFAFTPVRQSWNADYTERTISEVKLYDVSVVTYPANPSTVVKLRGDDEQDAAETGEAKPGRPVSHARRQQAADAAKRRR